MPGLADITEPTDIEAAPESPKVVKEAEPKVHQERPGFTGDRVLRNSEIFMLEFGWWIEMAYAVPEGDIGRVWEIMKVSLIQHRWCRLL
jgi:hypothetical protein